MFLSWCGGAFFLSIDEQMLARVPLGLGTITSACQQSINQAFANAAIGARDEGNGGRELHSGNPRDGRAYFFVDRPRNICMAF
jgi:hypothetical protein